MDSSHLINSSLSPAAIAAQGTLMFSEAASASAVVARQLAANTARVRELALRLRQLSPSLVFTCARGSSDHAATFAKYLIETQLGIPVLSQAPSLSSIYGAPLLHMQNQLFVIISQSGRSPDLLVSADAAKRAGALVVALVNDMDSPLASMAEFVLPLHAGQETSVAATKSYIATLSAFVHLVSHLRDDKRLAQAVEDLPSDLECAWRADWSPAIEVLNDKCNLYVLGRGLTLGIAQEAALKFKETCGIHGEAFSIAEVAHGPMALVAPDFPVLVFPPLDHASVGLNEAIATFGKRGAPTMMAGSGTAAQLMLPLKTGLHSATGPISMIQSFYRLVNGLAVERGYDPDKPPMLSKVTQTL